MAGLPIPPFRITDIRGGINNTDSPTKIRDDQIVDARNVDFRSGALGAKRNGTEGVSLSGSILNSPCIAIIRHTPGNTTASDEIWAIDENGHLDRYVGGAWNSGSITKVNNFVGIRARSYEANGVSLHGKLFIAADTDYDRLIVWDGTVLRWAGFWQTPVPSVADSGVAGSFASTRYYRIRFVQQNSAGAVIRRSEPSNTVAFAPSGAKDGAVITKPAGTEVVTSVYCEGQTHWEVEASLDNILFYRIATVAIATTTYTDQVSASTGYATNTLSENIGEYQYPGAPRHLAIDEDRVVMAGSYFRIAEDATVWWTPIGAAFGVGNDERLPDSVQSYIAFDGLDGGRVTALVSGTSGSVYVFKLTRTYKMVRTGISAAAYDPINESFTRGATLRGACGGTDKEGVSCVYFTDPSVGLCRAGQRGVEILGRDIRKTWEGRNPAPAIGPRLVHYPLLDQVWYTLPTGTGDVVQTAVAAEIWTATNDQILTAQTSPGLMAEYEVRHGSMMFHSGYLASAQALGLLASDTGLVPYIGTASLAIGGGNNSVLHQTDIGTTDGGTTFQAYVKTKQYTLGDLWTKFGVMAGILLTKAASGTSFLLRMIRNDGVETRDITVDLSPAGAEPSVVKPMDNSSMSELNSIQFQYGDSAASAQVWDVDEVAFKVRREDQSGG